MSLSTLVLQTRAQLLRGISRLRHFKSHPWPCVWCAQVYAQRKTSHPRSTVHPRRQVAVLWQLLTLTATCKWMAHMTADAGTLTADVTKLLERSGRLGSHRVATFTFGVRCFDEPVGPVRGSSDGSCPRNSGTTTTSRTPTIIVNEERSFAASEGAWQLELELAQPSLAPGLPSLTVHGCTGPPFARAC